MSEPKTMVINCALCDATQTREETLQAYDQVVINAATVLVSEESVQLLHRYNVSLNAAAVYTVPAGCRPKIQNGRYTISGDRAPERPTALMVNGALTIQPGSKEALRGYAAILVNGSVSCPESLSGQLPQLQVNGSTIIYPDNAILLKRTFVVDPVFVLRAKKADYFAQRRVVLVDDGLDVAALADKGVKFLTRQAIVAQPLLEQAIPLFDDETEIVAVPQGCAFVNDDLKLTDAALRKHGTKLYVNGNLLLTTDASHALGQLEYLKVNGTVLLPASLLESFEALNAEYNDLKVVKGTLVTDRPAIKVGLDALQQEDGLELMDCAAVTLSPDLPPQLIREKLAISDCAVVNCTPEQRDAVEAVSQDVAAIEDGTDGDADAGSPLGFLKDLFSGKRKMVNAANYQL